MKNWKTTSVGLLAALTFVASHGQQASSFVPAKWQPLAIAITGVAIALLGLLAKDAGTPPK